MSQSWVSLHVKIIFLLKFVSETCFKVESKTVVCSVRCRLTVVFDVVTYAWFDIYAEVFNKIIAHSQTYIT